LTIWDLINAHFSLFAFLIALMTCAPLIWVSGDPVKEIVLEIIKEFGSILRGPESSKALNAIGGIVCLAALILLIERSPIELLGGQITGHDMDSSSQLASTVISSAAIPMLLIYFIVSIHLTRKR
jgi:hypothetical protein